MVVGVDVYRERESLAGVERAETHDGLVVPVLMGRRERIDAVVTGHHVPVVAAPLSATRHLYVVSPAAVPSFGSNTMSGSSDVDRSNVTDSTVTPGIALVGHLE